MSFLLKVYIQFVSAMTSRSWMFLARHLPANTSIDAKFEVLRTGRDRDHVAVDEIYKLLTILDSKASALMRYDGIILAVVTFSTRAGQPFSKLVYTILLLTIISIFACLMVVGVFWNLLGYIEATEIEGTAKNKETKGDVTKELDALRKLLLLRETAYQTAWWCALLVSVLLAVYFIRTWNPWSLP
jgi:hypothetical protein